MACAWAAFFCYLSMMATSYFVGKKYYPVPYRWGAALRYVLLAAVLYVAAMYVPISNTWALLAFRAVLLSLFVAYAVRRDLPLAELPFVGRYFKK